MSITQSGPKSVGEIKKYFEHGDLFLSPVEYQRESVWKLEQKMRLIDTIFCELDIPKFYLWKINLSTLTTQDGYPDGETKKKYKEILMNKQRDNDDPNPYIYEVVDGQQRIRTILEYMGVKAPSKDVYRGPWHDPFQAEDDTPIAKGKLFSSLNAAQQLKFETVSLTVMVLENATIKEIRDMFLRLQNGTPLNAQQKRDAKGSQIGNAIRPLTAKHFFTTSVNFENNYSEHSRVLAQIYNLELKGKIVSSTSTQLDKLYAHYITTPVDADITRKISKTLDILGKIFPTKCPHLNKQYALSIYWVISKINEMYTIDPSDHLKINENFKGLDLKRLEARQRDYGLPEDDVYADLSNSMAHGTDGRDGIAIRTDILMQRLFTGVNLQPLPSLDPNRAFSHEEKLILYARANGLCKMEHGSFICNKPIDFDEAVVDHIVPHSHGGRTELSNGRIAYGPCNLARLANISWDPATKCKKLAASTTATP
jgi:hypothetical protein